MSNPTTEPNVIKGAPVITPTEPVLEPAPKQPGKFKTAVRHPIQTVKRNKAAFAASAGVALGSVATFLLMHKDENEDADASENTDASDDSETESTG